MHPAGTRRCDPLSVPETMKKPVVSSLAIAGKPTPPTPSLVVRGVARPLSVLAACVFILAGCGSSGSVPSNAPGSPATVITKHVAGYGTVLATASGRALYVLTADRPGTSRCSGQCTADWRPLVPNGSLVAGRGVNGSLLATFKRSGGGMQVMYDGHPLYTYAGSAPASLAVGTIAFGGVWYYVSPSGTAIEQTASGGY